jgi:hypothetical protein
MKPLRLGENRENIGEAASASAYRINNVGTSCRRNIALCEMAMKSSK